MPRSRSVNPPLNECTGRDVMSVSTSRSQDAPTSRLGLNKLQRLCLGRLTSRSRLFASRAQEVILPILVWIKGTENCIDFLSLSEQGVYAWSRLNVIAPYNLILWIIIINGHEYQVTTAIIITCRPRPILKSRWRLVSYQRLVSVLSWNLNVLSRSRLGWWGQSLGLVLGFNVSCPSMCTGNEHNSSFWVCSVSTNNKKI